MNAACTARYHDTYSAAHNHGCICPKARIEDARRSSYYKDLHRRGIRLREPALGTVRRIQALQVMGYSTLQLKALMGRSARTKSNLYPRERGGTGMINSTTAAQWRDLYERICMTPATGPRANHVRTTARRKGWAGPLDWDDIDNPDEIPYSQTPEAKALRALERKREHDRSMWPQKKARLQAERQAA